MQFSVKKVSRFELRNNFLRSFTFFKLIEYVSMVYCVLRSVVYPCNFVLSYYFNVSIIHFLTENIYRLPLRV